MKTITIGIVLCILFGFSNGTETSPTNFREHGLVSSTNFRSLQNCPINCYSCSTSGICTSCNSGYYLSSEICLPCSSTGFNCVTCSNDYSCTSCISSYYLSSGTCYACPADCVTCTAKGCATCPSGYTLLPSGTCVYSSTSCSQSNADGCTSCYNGYYLSQYSCLVCASGCSDCDNFFQCYGCYSNYAYSNGICTYNGPENAGGMSVIVFIVALVILCLTTIWCIVDYRRKQVLINQIHDSISGSQQELISGPTGVNIVNPYNPVQVQPQQMNTGNPFYTAQGITAPQ